MYILFKNKKNFYYDFFWNVKKMYIKTAIIKYVENKTLIKKKAHDDACTLLEPEITKKFQIINFERLFPMICML